MSPISNEKFYNKSNRQDLAKKNIFSVQDTNSYYKVLLRIVFAYNESLLFFSRGDFKLVNKNNAVILNKLIDIYKNRNNIDKIIQIIDNERCKKILNKENSNKSEIFKILRNKDKAAFGFYYKEYKRLLEFFNSEEKIDELTGVKTKTDKITDNIIKNVMSGNEDANDFFVNVFNKLNKNLAKESSNRNYGDRSDYYLTFTDMQIYEYLISPIVSFHGIIVSFIFPIAGAAVASTVTTTGSGTGIGIAKDQFINILKRVYNIAIRDNKYYQIDKIKFNEKMSSASDTSNFNISNSVSANSQNQLDFDLYKMRDILKQLEQISTRNSEFNFFVSNSFKYYAKLKMNLEKLKNDFIAGRNVFTNLNELDDPVYKNIVNKNKDIYYKALSYYRNKNTVEQTLKVQINSMKFISKSLLIMLRGNSEFKIFLNHFNKKYNYNYYLVRKSSYRDKISNIMTKKLSNISNYNDFLDFIIVSLNDLSPDISSEIKLNSLFNEFSEHDKIDFDPSSSKYSNVHKNETLKDKTINNINSLGGNELFIRQVIKIINISKTTDVFTEYSDLYDWGLWSSLGLLDGILYLSNSTSASNKFKTISSIFTAISGFYKASNLALGSVNLAANTLEKFKVLDLSSTIFSNPTFSSFAINPFSMMTTVLEMKLSSSVKSNYEAIWNDICKDFENFKNQNNGNNKFPRSSAYDYFINHKKIDPIEAIHKITDLFKDKLNNVVSSAKKINDKMINLHEKVHEYNVNNKLIDYVKNKNEKKSFASYFKFNVTPEKTEEEIIVEYIKIILSILSFAKEVQSYNYFVEFLSDLDLEIEDYLKLNFILLTNDDKAIFSVLNFASNSEINRDIFEDLH